MFFFELKGTNVRQWQAKRGGWTSGIRPAVTGPFWGVFEGSRLRVAFLPVGIRGSAGRP